MTSFARRLLPGAFAACLCCEAAMAADLSTFVGKWVGQYPSDEIVDGKPLWDQPGIEEVMRAASANIFCAAAKRHAPSGNAGGSQWQALLRRVDL
jgi:hypothetical protein